MDNHGQKQANSDWMLRLHSAFPRVLAVDVEEVVNCIPPPQLPPSESDIGTIRINGESVRIPFRIYSSEPDPISVDKLGAKPNLIFACVFTRHHDGFVRQRHLKTLLRHQETWVPPFVLQLVGEYVLEIIEEVERDIDALHSESYARFLTHNQEFVALTKKRVISYWTCYYRSRFPRLRSYPGFRVLESFKLWRVEDARRLLAS